MRRRELQGFQDERQRARVVLLSHPLEREISPSLSEHGQCPNDHTGRVEVRALANVREPRRFLRASVNRGASRRIHQQRRLARFLRRTF